MNPTSDIIRQLLIDLGHGTPDGLWPIFVSFIPDAPDNAICIYDTAGRLDGRRMEDGLQVEHQGIQVRVRGPIYLDVWTKVNEIALHLDAVRGVSVAPDSGNQYSVENVSRTGSILPVGVEEEGDRRRHHFTLNAVVSIAAE